jgi:hypothetical protein
MGSAEYYSTSSEVNSSRVLHSTYRLKNTEEKDLRDRRVGISQQALFNSGFSLAIQEIMQFEGKIG